MAKAPSDPADWDKYNFSVKALHVNAPNALNTFQTITRNSVSHPAQKSYEVRLFSPGAGAPGDVGGYKCAIDRSGNFLILEAEYAANGNTTPDMNAKVVIDLQAAPTATERYRFLLYAGHSTQGDGVEYGHNTAGYAPDGTCILCRKKWNYATLTTDPRACNTHPLTGDNPNLTPSLFCSPNETGANLPNSQGTPISAPSYWNMRGDYAHIPVSGDGSWVGYFYGCKFGDCTAASNERFNGEIVMMRTDGTNASNPNSGFKRVAHTRFTTAGLTDPEVWHLLYQQAPVLSPDGQFFAFVSTGKHPAPTSVTDQLAVFAVRVPQ